MLRRYVTASGIPPHTPHVSRVGLQALLGVCTHGIPDVPPFSVPPMSIGFGRAMRSVVAVAIKHAVDGQRMPKSLSETLMSQQIDGS